MFGSSLLFHVPHAQELSHVKEIIGFQLFKNIVLHEGKIKCFLIESNEKASTSNKRLPSKKWDIVSLKCDPDYLGGIAT